jgi:hypothetical protein
VGVGLEMTVPLQAARPNADPAMTIHRQLFIVCLRFMDCSTI